MVNKLGFDWTMTMFAIILTLLIPVPVWIMKYGPQLRGKSVYVKIAREEQEESGEGPK
jgi:hypothetical protein